MSKASASTLCFNSVHYPTDVIGGWILGFGWALLCWLIAQRFEANTGVTAERQKKEK